MGKVRTIGDAVIEKVKESLDEGLSQRETARRYKISIATVNLIANGKFEEFRNKIKPTCPITGWSYDYRSW